MNGGCFLRVFQGKFTVKIGQFQVAAGAGLPF
jgi:hypothetical protein